MASGRRRAVIWRRTAMDAARLPRRLARRGRRQCGSRASRSPTMSSPASSSKRGVQATYSLERIGLRTQQVSNLVIGDPGQSRPHRAHRARSQMRIKWNGSVEVYRIAARGVRLHGQGGRQQGQLGPDRQIASAAERQAIHAAQYRRRRRRYHDRAGDALSGRSASRCRGAAICRAGSRAGSPPRPRGWRPGACRLEQLRAYRLAGGRWRGARTSAGRSVRGRFTCPASRLALTEPRMEIDSTFSEAFGSFDGKGRLSMTSLVAGVNGLAAVNSNLTFKGSATDIRGRDRPSRAPGAAGAGARRPHQYRGPIPARRAARRADAGRRLWRVERPARAGADRGDHRAAGLGQGHAAGADRRGAGRARCAARRAASTSRDRSAWSTAAAAAGCGSAAPARARASGAAIDVSGGDGVTYLLAERAAARRRRHRRRGRRAADGADRAPPAAQRRGDERHRD